MRGTSQIYRVHRDVRQSENRNTWIDAYLDDESTIVALSIFLPRAVVHILGVQQEPVSLVLGWDKYNFRSILQV